MLISPDQLDIVIKTIQCLNEYIDIPCYGIHKTRKGEDPRTFTPDIMTNSRAEINLWYDHCAILNEAEKKEGRKLTKDEIEELLGSNRFYGLGTYLYTLDEEFRKIREGLIKEFGLTALV